MMEDLTAQVRSAVVAMPTLMEELRTREERQLAPEALLGGAGEADGIRGEREPATPQTLPSPRRLRPNMGATSRYPPDPNRDPAPPACLAKGLEVCRSRGRGDGLFALGRSFAREEILAPFSGDLLSRTDFLAARNAMRSFERNQCEAGQLHEMQVRLRDYSFEFEDEGPAGETRGFVLVGTGRVSSAMKANSPNVGEQPNCAILVFPITLPAPGARSGLLDITFLLPLLVAAENIPQGQEALLN